MDLIVVLITAMNYGWQLRQPAATAAASSYTNFLPLISYRPGYDWLQFNGDAQHSGNNELEQRINVNNVNQLQLLFKVPLPGIADGVPVYLSAVRTASGIHDLIFVTNTDGHIAAVDAHKGGLIWSQQNGPNGCLINNNSARNETCYTTSSPAIDPNKKYVYSYGLDGYVHKYIVGTGVEITSGGWPELTTLKGYDEKGSSALSIATADNGISYLYIAHAGYPGDQGNYQGHITAINLNDGSQKVFNTLCSNQASHFWIQGSQAEQTATLKPWVRFGLDREWCMTLIMIES